MSKQAFEKKLSDLEQLRSMPPSKATLVALRKALLDKNNYFVSRSASIAGALGCKELAPDLEAAFDRFLLSPVKTDPQCWAKNAVVKALVDLEYDAPGLFKKGLRHVQLEPVWGTHEDTADTLRGRCALAVASSAQIPADERLVLLIHTLADEKRGVRVEGARAIAHMGLPECARLLRLKILCGDSEPEVLGQCFHSLLELAPRPSIEFVAGFLNSADEDLRAEAAAGLSACHEPEAFEALRVCFENQSAGPFKNSLLVIMATMRQPVAIDFLVALVAAGKSHAAEALRPLRCSGEIRERLAAAVEQSGNATLAELLHESFPV